MAAELPNFVNVRVKNRRPNAELTNKRKTKEEDFFEVWFGKTKRLKTEQGFHRDRSERCLEMARIYAQDGDRCMMDYCLNEARAHNRKLGTNSLLATFELEAQVTQIRGTLGDAGSFHAKKLHEHLNKATAYSLEGNRDLMEYRLEEAKNNAECGGSTLNRIFNGRAHIIRHSLLVDNEVSFHKKQMHLNLTKAKAYAQKGNRNLMDFCLQQGKEHAERLEGYPSRAFWDQVERIRGLLGSELEYHLKEFQRLIASAKRSAEMGNRSLTEFQLEKAKDNAEKAGCWDIAAQKRSEKIARSITSETDIATREIPTECIASTISDVPDDISSITTDNNRELTFPATNVPLRSQPILHSTLNQEVSSTQGAKPTALLPKPLEDKLQKRIKRLVSMWAEEEQMVGNDICYWHIMPNTTIKIVASQCPTTLVELQAINGMEPKIIKQYGARLIKNIQHFVEMESLEALLAMKKRDAVFSNTVLSAPAERKLKKHIKQEVSIWAEEEQLMGNKIYYWHIMSNKTMQAISSQCPTSLEELQALSELGHNVSQEYRERLINCIKHFVESEGLQTFLMSQKMNSTDVASDDEFAEFDLM